MNKKLIITLGLIAIITSAAYADSTIYTDNIGRMHFLGRDAANNQSSGTNYTNSAEQDLTRRLYEQSANESINDASYDQHPLKNYENTFPDSRFGTTKYWKTKYGNNTDDAIVKTKDSYKATSTATKGQTDYSGQQFGSTILDTTQESVKNEIKTSEKKHWWNRK